MMHTTLQSAESSRAARRADTRARLLAAARQLFVERGFHATRPQDITRLAGTGHGTFYLHFTDKRACFLAFADEARAELDAMVRARASAAQSLPDLIALMLEGIFAYAEAHPGVLVTAMSDDEVIAPGAARQSTVVSAWAGDLAGQFREFLGGQAPPDLDLRVAGAGIVGFVHQASLMARGLALPPDHVIRMLTDFIVRGLGAAHSQERAPT